MNKLVSKPKKAESRSSKVFHPSAFTEPQNVLSVAGRELLTDPVCSATESGKFTPDTATTVPL